MIVRALIKGGIIIPSVLSKILKLAKEAENEHIYLGSRQDILFNISDSVNIHDLHFSNDVDIIKEQDTSAYQNIVSSIVSVDIAESTPWIHKGSYFQILENFDYKPSLRINITDPEQSLVPLLSGNLNFIASKYSKYWFLYIQKTYTDLPQQWPALIHSYDIARISKTIEKILTDAPRLTIKEIFRIVNEKVSPNNRMIDYTFVFPISKSPQYEGINNMVNEGKMWAGFFWRNNKYSITFLETVAVLCEKQDIAHIYFTPWKSFLVKDLDSKAIPNWEAVIGQFGITMRHSALALNWHISLQDEASFELKQYLVKEMDKKDIRTEGLTFTIQTSPINLFTSIVIRPNVSTSKFRFSRKTYTILYAQDFNPNTRTYIEFETNIFKSKITGAIDFLSKQYYKSIYAANNNEQPVKAIINKNTIHKHNYVHQCKDCKTVYDENIGSVLNNIPVGTPFDNLPDNFTCPTCNNDKTSFEFVEMDYEKR